MPLPLIGRIRPRPERLTKELLLERALLVARDPGKLRELPKAYQQPVDQVVKALSVGSGAKFQPDTGRYCRGYARAGPNLG